METEHKSIKFLGISFALYWIACYTLNLIGVI